MSIPTDTESLPRVLVADDDPTARTIMREVLAQAGFNVIEAADGNEALRLYESAMPDVVLLDVKMPGRDGFSVCEAIRSRESVRQTPIFIVTGLDDAISVDRAYHLGATDFINKPIAWPVLAHRVRYVLRASEALNDIRGLVSALPDRIFVLDENGRELERLDWQKTQKRSRIEGLADASFEHIFSAEDHDRLREFVAQALATGRSQTHEHFFTDAGMHVETRFVPRDRQSVLAIMRDTTDRKEFETRIYDLAYYDTLTGLPNRRLFKHELDAIIEARGDKITFSLLFVDLDRFKRINDSMGHSVGDRLLKVVSHRLEDCIRSQDVLARVDGESDAGFQLARLGGDEFVILLHDVSCETAASAVASRIIGALGDPLDCDGHQFVVTPSIGIAMYPQDGKTSDELLMSADSAMYRAKANGRNNYHFFSDTMKVRSLKRLDIEVELRKAIEDEQFLLYYQPKVDLESLRIIGAEALLRWNHPERGWIPPTDFITIAEESGLILPIGKWVLHAACEQLSRWRQPLLEQLRLSVNVSSQQVYSDDLIATVTEAVAESGISPSRLELEITEGMLMRDVEATIDTLTTLKEFGIGLSVDDFGTGYSSLSYLKRFPIDILKIDRSFVTDLHCDADDAAICAAILAMARKLGLKVVAEGVEIEEQLKFLREHGCDQVQGYLFGKPLAPDDFAAFVMDQAGTCDRASGL